MREKIGLPQVLEEHLTSFAAESGLEVRDFTNAQILIVQAMLKPWVVSFRRGNENVLAVVELAPDNGRFETALDKRRLSFDQRREELCRRWNSLGVSVLSSEKMAMKDVYGNELTLFGERFYFMVEMPASGSVS